MPEAVLDTSVSVTRSFECEVPETERSIKRLQEALPFPEKLDDVLSWAGEFVERIALQPENEQKVLLLPQFSKPFFFEPALNITRARQRLTRALQIYGYSLKNHKRGFKKPKSSLVRKRMKRRPSIKRLPIFGLN